jgi:UTP-glucose-1-phosphate uridylyltransferase
LDYDYKMSQLNTLVILAGGNGSRFGGAKQFTCFGHLERTLMEYNLYHAIDAGFNHVVFITQAEQKAQLEREVIPRLPENLTINIVIQALTVLPEACHISPKRTKPLGTAHALWCAKELIKDAFVVINADDYYGRQVFEQLQCRQKEVYAANNTVSYAMVAYLIENTLSEYGGVNRGLCEYNRQMQLKNIEEIESISQIQEDRNTIIRGNISNTKETITIAPNALVSMNCWTFTPQIFPAITHLLIDTFVADANEKVECYLPDVVMSQLSKKQINVDVLTSKDNWFGVTYAADSVSVNNKINQIITTLKLSLSFKSKHS